MPERVDPGSLSPNALLILLAIDALESNGIISSPKSDDVGALLGTNAAWVHRHGKHLESPGYGAPSFATLSSNGHCFTNDAGKDLARLLRCGAPPDVEPPTNCGCGCGQAGGCIGGRQIYECGIVKQWCPDHVPGLDKPEIAPRSRKAQHEGVWISVTPCMESRLRRYGREVPANDTSDGTNLLPGLPVTANLGSNAKQVYMQVEGVVMAAAAGIALVSWPSSVGGPAVEAEIFRASQLILPGALDTTGLSAHQNVVLSAYRDGTATFERDADGILSGTIDNRRINPRTTEILEARSLVADTPWEANNAPRMR